MQPKSSKSLRFRFRFENLIFLPDSKSRNRIQQVSFFITRLRSKPIRTLAYACLANVKRLKVDCLVENVEALVVEVGGVRHLQD